jgi:hypothetical protein
MLRFRREISSKNFNGIEIFAINFLQMLKNSPKSEFFKVLYMESPKIPKAFRRKEPGQGTNTNRCVIMRKV